MPATRVTRKYHADGQFNKALASFRPVGFAQCYDEAVSWVTSTNCYLI